MESNIPAAVYPCQNLDPASALTLFPTGNKDCPRGALGVSSTASGCGGPHQHTPAQLLALKGIFGEYFFPSGHVWFCLQCCHCSAPAQASPAFPQWPRQSSGAAPGPTPGCRGHGAVLPADLTAQPFPCPLHLLPTSSILLCFNADYRLGSCQEMPCFKCFPPTQKLPERFLREREKP